MKQSFTKIYDKEEELLFQTNSINAYRVYIHLKKDNSFFKKEFMDLRRCIADYLNMPERTVKDAIKRLIKVGLIQTKKKGKVNYYILPYDSQNKPIICKEDERKPDVQKEEQQTEQECPTVHTEPIISPIYEEVEQSNRETNSVVQEKVEIKNIDFYYQFVSGSIQQWIHWYNTGQTSKLNEDVKKRIAFISTFNYNMTEEECYKKIFNYITANVAS